MVLGSCSANWPVHLWKLLPEGLFDPTLSKDVLGVLEVRHACLAVAALSACVVLL